MFCPPPPHRCRPPNYFVQLYLQVHQGIVGPLSCQRETQCEPNRCCYASDNFNEISDVASWKGQYVCYTSFQNDCEESRIINAWMHLVWGHKLLILNPLDATWPIGRIVVNAGGVSASETRPVINWLYLCGGSRWVGDCVGYHILFISERKNAFIGGKYWINTNAWAFPLPNHAERKKQQQHYSMWYSGFPSPLPPASRSRYGHFRCCFAFDNVDKEFDGASWNYNECYIMSFQTGLRREHNDNICIVAYLRPYNNCRSRHQLMK